MYPYLLDFQMNYHLQSISWHFSTIFETIPPEIYMPTNPHRLFQRFFNKFRNIHRFTSVNWKKKQSKPLQHSLTMNRWKVFVFRTRFWRHYTRTVAFESRNEKSLMTSKIAFGARTADTFKCNHLCLFKNLPLHAFDQSKNLRNRKDLRCFHLFLHRNPSRRPFWSENLFFFPKLQKWVFVTRCRILNTPWKKMS